jgi:hypothetical protein
MRHLLLGTLCCWSCSGSLSAPSGDGGAGGAGGSCAGGMVEFRLEAADTSAWFVYYSGQSCTPPSFLSIYDATGTEVAIGSEPDAGPCCTYRLCGSCRFDVVCAGWTQGPLPVTRTWNATMYPPGTCGGLACVSELACAPPGSYTARMCASRNGDNQQETACVDVPFDLPRSTPVTGVLLPV